MISLTQMAYGSRVLRHGRSRWPRAYHASRRWLIAGPSLPIDDAQPFRDDGETLRIHVPRFEFRVQGLQADLFVLPLVLARKTLRLV